jgi:GNAT superfamily N-acetyltransferase
MAEPAFELSHRLATPADVPLLGGWNGELIRDEGHRNRMDVAELEERMRGWLAGEYVGVIFSSNGRPVAYALFRESECEIYLRQFFVCRDVRRQGIGRAAMQILLNDVWPRDKRLTVDVLCQNAAAIGFWRSLEYRDYCLTLEILPGRSGAAGGAAGLRGAEG